MPNSFALVKANRFALLLVLAAAGAGIAQADPADVQRQLLDALARSDVPAAVALFTDDAVIDTESGYCAKSPCVGKAAIQKDFERYVKDATRRVTPLNTFVSGNVLVTRFEARSATIKSAGVDRVASKRMVIAVPPGTRSATSFCLSPSVNSPLTSSCRLPSRMDAFKAVSPLKTSETSSVNTTSDVFSRVPTD